jgi:hypothetical protein
MAGKRRIGIDRAARHAGACRLAAVRFIENGAQPRRFGRGEIEKIRHETEPSTPASGAGVAKWQENQAATAGE